MQYLLDATAASRSSTIVRALESGHADKAATSLWFVATIGRDEPLAPDAREFADVRWWTPAELAAADLADFDPHLGRFLSKIGS